MTRDQMKAQRADEEVYVPKDNTDLVRVYRPYVTRLVLKYNRVTSNTDDLLQHVWDQLFTVKVLEKYHRSAGVQRPREMRAEDAARFLKATWGQFKVLLWRFKEGDVRDSIDQIPQDIKKRVFERDHGVCSDPSHGDKPFDAVRFAEALATLKKVDKVKYNLLRERYAQESNITKDKRVFWVVEKVSGARSRDLCGYKTKCLFCLQRDRAANGYLPDGRKKGAWAPTPISGTWASKKAMYLTSDIEKLRDLRKGNNRTKEQPFTDEETTKAWAMEGTASPTHFKRYLARAVHNIYANWCRTRSRKYKELYLAPKEDGQAWEAFLEDSSDMDPETKIILTEEANECLDSVVSKIARKVKKGEIDGNEIAKLISEGYTLAEIIKMKNLPRVLLQAARRQEA